MHPSEIEDIMKTFTICVDSREKPTERAKTRYRQFGCPYVVEKLDFGDYSAKVFLPDGKPYKVPASCERKMSLDEICGNFTHERDRFVREFKRAKDAGEKIILLVEGGSWKAAYGGRYRSQMAPKALVSSLMTWLARYNCQIIFAEAELSGRIIHDILYREAREALERMVDE